MRSCKECGEPAAYRSPRCEPCRDVAARRRIREQRRRKRLANPEKRRAERKAWRKRKRARDKPLCVRCGLARSPGWSGNRCSLCTATAHAPRSNVSFCLNCEMPFETSRGRRCCSLECKKERKRALDRAEYQARWMGNREELLRVRPSLRRERAGPWQLTRCHCGSLFQRFSKRHARWCSVTCKLRRIRLRREGIEEEAIPLRQSLARLLVALHPALGLNQWPQKKDGSRRRARRLLYDPEP